VMEEVSADVMKALEAEAQVAHLRYTWCTTHSWHTAHTSRTPGAQCMLYTWCTTCSVNLPRAKHKR
jgi:hypothetical protein